MLAKKIEIKHYKIKDLNPAAYNPRDITDRAFEGLKESIKKFGLVDPLIFNLKTKTLVGGHQRLKAAESLGLETVPVVEVNLSLSEEKALNVTLNNQAISGHYIDTLQDLLAEIKFELPEFDNVLLGDLELKFTPDLPDDIDMNEPKTSKYNLIISFEDEQEQQEAYDELKSKGYKIKASK